MALIATVIFILEYAAILVEHRINKHKAIMALGAGVVLWILAALANPPHYEENLEHATLEVAEIFFFLFFAMAHIANIEDQGFFDWVRSRIYGLGLGDRAQFLLIQVFTFFGSALFDNLTITIVSVALARLFFAGKNLAMAAIGIVFAANAGGAWSPIGDIPTIMFWLAGKFSAREVILGGLTPSVVNVVIVTSYLYFQFQRSTSDEIPERVSFGRDNAILAGLSIASFLLPIAFRQIGQGLPPLMGLGLGASVVWALRHTFHQDEGDTLGAPEEGVEGNGHHHATVLSREIYRTLRSVDWATLVFFMGILYSVSALSALGVLAQAAAALKTGWDLIPGIDVETSDSWIYLNNDIVGFFSAVVDNIPTAALSLATFTYEHSYHWVHLAYTLGTGGSLIPIGSAAGIVALGMVPEIRRYYFKVAFIAGLPAFLAGAVIGQLMAPLFT